MYCVNLKGSYYEMGLYQGQLLKQAGFTLPAPEEKMVKFARQCEAVVGQYMPELVEEIHGVAEGAGIDYDTVMTLTMTAPFDPEEVPGCSIVAVMPEKTVDRQMIVGRNFDMFEDVSKEGATTFCTYPEGGYASVGNCDIWVGRWDGLNEAGLFTGSTSIHLPGPRPVLPGPVGWFTGRYVLDNCATAEEALKFFKLLPRTGSGGRLIADSSGHAVVVEAGVEGYEIRYPEDGLLVVTNHAVSQRFSGKEPFVPESSRPRYNRIRTLLGRCTSINVEDVKSALSDHKGSVCAHEKDPSGRIMATIWSVVARPGDRQVKIAEGSPCKTEYRTVHF